MQIERRYIHTTRTSKLVSTLFGIHASETAGTPNVLI